MFTMLEIVNYKRQSVVSSERTKRAGTKARRRRRGTHVYIYIYIYIEREMDRYVNIIGMFAIFGQRIVSSERTKRAGTEGKAQAEGYAYI